MTTDAPVNKHGDMMDRIYASTRHVYDLSRRYYLFGRDLMIRNIEAQPGQVVCEVGCGTARNLVQASKLYPDAKFCGLDASKLMLETARANLNRAGLKQVPLAHAYAESFDPAQLFPAGYDRLDHVIFPFSLTMIPPWQEALTHCWDRLEPGGSLHVADFGELEQWPGFARRPFLAFLAAFHVTPNAAIHDWGQGLANASLEQKRIWGGYSVVTKIVKT